MQTVVFSKDRAAQLDLLLRSLKENGNGIFRSVVVLYDCSEPEFEEGYEFIKKKYRKIAMARQTKFRKDLINILSFSNKKHICFFTDDDVMYRPINITMDQIKDLEIVEGNIVCLSLRLGNNTVVQDQYNNTISIMPHDFEFVSPFLIWNWNGLSLQSNFGYPLSVDGHIFSRQTILDILKDPWEFHNPNTLEHGWQPYRTTLSKRMACLPHSVVVNTPINRVQETAPNRAGEKFGEDPMAMNNSLLAGWYISLEKTDFSEVVGCHQEIKLEWDI